MRRADPQITASNPISFVGSGGLDTRRDPLLEVLERDVRAQRAERRIEA